MLNFLSTMMPFFWTKNNLKRELEEKQEALANKESEINRQQKIISMLKEYAEEKEDLFKKREAFLAEEKKFLIERTMALEIREKSLESEKEKMLDSDSLEIKRKIILPSLQDKWKAEAKKLDADRVKILQSSPKVKHSIARRKEELETSIAQIKSKPKNQANNDLIIENESRLSELKRITGVIDENSSAGN